MTELSPENAALRLAKLRARQILQSNADPLKHARDFHQMWVDADYCRALSEYGPLDEDVYVAQVSGQTDDQIRAWLLEKLKALAASLHSSRLHSNKVAAKLIYSPPRASHH